MILYSSDQRMFSGRSYDGTYAADREHFQHRQITFPALDIILSRFVKPHSLFGCIDIGCGQGQVLGYVLQKVREEVHCNIDTSRMIGVDVSTVAINQSNEKYPECNWVGDSYQQLLKNHEIKELVEGRLDLVINKGGLTFVGDETEYRAMMRVTKDLLRNEGVYLFIQNKRFFQRWSRRKCATWDASIFDINEEIYGPPTIINNKAYYVYCYTKSSKGNDQKGLQPKIAKKVIFNLDNGNTVEVLVAGDELSSKRIAVYEPQRYQEPVIIGYADNQQLRFSITGKELNKLRKETIQPKNETRNKAIATAFHPGDPSILLLKARMHADATTRIDIVTPLLEILRNKRNIGICLHRCESTISYCDFVCEWLAAKPSLVVIGTGLTDYFLPSVNGKPAVDIDEFRNRLSWVMEVLSGECTMKTLYVMDMPVGESTDPKRRMIMSEKIAEGYKSVAEELCDQYRVPVFDPSRYYQNMVRTLFHGVFKRKVERARLLSDLSEKILMLTERDKPALQQTV